MSTHRLPSLGSRELQVLSRPIPLQLIGLVLMEWSLVALTLYAAVNWLSPWWYPLVAFVIASRQHALAILGHEFAHHHFSRRRKWLNDALGDLLTAAPLFGTVQSYRAMHFAHHRHTGTDSDPNWTKSLQQRRYGFPLSPLQFLAEVVKQILLVNLPQFLRYDAKDDYFGNIDAASRWRHFGFLAVLVAVLSYRHLWLQFLAYWVVPMLTFFAALLYMRYAGEHHALPLQRHRPALTRTVCGNWFERCFLLPHAVGHHLEHHLYPSVPCIRLVALHRRLCEDPAFLRGAVITRGYFSGLLKEFAVFSSPPPTATPSPARPSAEATS